MKKTLIVPLSILLILAFGLACAPKPTPTAPPSPTPAAKPAPIAPKLPEILTMTTYQSGTTGFSVATALVPSLEKYTPMKVRMETYGPDLDKFIPVSDGTAQLVQITGAGSWLAAYGKSVFAKLGPQRVRQVWQGESQVMFAVVKASSSIKTAADLKGRKVSVVPGSPLNNGIVGAALAFAGLTYKDVQQVPFSGFAEAVQAIGIGASETNGGSTVSAAVVELATKFGIRAIQLPASDTAGWARVKQTYGYVLPRKVTEPEGWVTAKDLPIDGEVYPTGLWTYDKISPDIIYAVTKAMDVGFPEYKQALSSLRTWGPDTVLKGLLDIPFHEGSIRYFKEKGMWTAELDKWQAQQLAAEKQRFDDYAKTGKDAWVAKNTLLIEGEP